jgi:lipoprotein signal peptidase
MATRRNALAPWLAVAAAVIVLDQVTKAMIVAAFRLGDARTLSPFFDIVRAHNRGAAFSFLNDASGWQRWFFVVSASSPPASSSGCCAGTAASGCSAGRWR